MYKMPNNKSGHSSLKEPKSILRKKSTLRKSSKKRPEFILYGLVKGEDSKKTIKLQIRDRNSSKKRKKDDEDAELIREKLERRAELKEQAAKKNAIKILNWLFENPHIDASNNIDDSTTTTTTEDDDDDSDDEENVKTKFLTNHEEENESDISAIDGVEELVSSKEFARLRSDPEWRIGVNGQSFRVFMNKDKGDSFYRSLAQALTTNEENRESIRQQICTHVLEDKMWQTRYMDQVKQSFLRRPPRHRPISINSKSKRIAKVYRNECLKQKKPGLTYFQLRAASDLFNFEFSLVFKRNTCFTWLNYNNNSQQKLNRKGELLSVHQQFFNNNKNEENQKRLFFLIWPHQNKNKSNKKNKNNNKPPIWNLLTPITCNNSKTNIETLDGHYPLYLRRSFNVNKCCFTRDSSSSSTGSNSKSNNNILGAMNPDNTWSKVITFQAGDEELGFPPENRQYPQGLFAILSIILFGNNYHTEEIWHEIMEHRSRFGYFINLNPMRKHVYRQSQHQTSSQDMRQQEQLTDGDAMDLKIAASLYKFCFTLISMNGEGHLSMISECRDAKTHSSHYSNNNNNNEPYLAFFTRITATKKIKWFKLEHFVAHNNGPRQSTTSDLHRISVPATLQKQSTSNKLSEKNK